MNKFLSTIIFICLSHFSAYSQFVTTWRTTTNGESITIPTTGGSGYNYTVNWGDGTTTTGHMGNAIHAYATAGDHTVTITGTFPRIYFNNGGDKNKIISIDSWGSNTWTNMSRAFYGCANLTYTAVDIPDLSLVKDMSSMFSSCSKFNGAIGSWDVSNVTSMRGIFSNAKAFNQPIGSWNMSSVKDMRDMFINAIAFNQNIGTWNVSNAQYMANMFNGAKVFNQPIGGWDVSSVMNMGAMFFKASAFNQPIGGWDVSSVTSMVGMFSSANAFNQPIGGWDVSSVIYMNDMFRNASAFNQPIGGWNVSSVITMSTMFNSASAFNQPIGGWNVSNVTNMSQMFNVASSFNQDISNWDVSSVINMSNMFSNTVFNKPLNKTLTGGWDVSNVKNMANMFANAKVFNQPLDGWDVSSVTNMSRMFANARVFNQPIGSWNVSSVTNMSRIFERAWAFNQPIGSWNVSQITNMGLMFFDARAFNKPIDSWDVSKVTNMEGMFYNSFAFNQPLSSWDVSSVTNMSRMFQSATSFNQPLSSWDVSNVTNMFSMFQSATSFNQSLSSWNISKVTQMDAMLNESSLNLNNYDNTLKAWATLTVKNGVRFGARGLAFCNAETERLSLINVYSWDIYGDAENCALPITLIDFQAKTKAGIVELYWETAQEIDNDYFEIERSSDALHWETISQVKGAGNSSNFLSYRSSDKKPYVNSVSYYRLKQVDFSGKFSYSPVRSVSIQSLTTALRLYPNPAVDKLTVEFSENMFTPVTLYTMLGQPLTQDIKIISRRIGEIDLDIKNLPAGSYIITIGHEKKIFRKL